MTELPTLPDADLLLIEALGTFGLTNLGTEIPDDLADRLPFAVAARFGGAATDPRFADRATVSVDVWASSRKAARDLSMDVFYGLRDAKFAQTLFTNGSIAAFTVITMPNELRTPEQLKNVWRFNAAYSLVLRSAN